MSDFRPRRSVLYLPASNPRAVEKATSLDADVVVLDLEDSVAPDAKEQARAAAADAVTSGRFGHRELVVRVNGVGTPWHADDLAAVGAADAVLVPKIESAEQVDGVARAVGDQAIWVMVETPRGVLHVEEIAAHARVAALVAGTNDLVNETFGRHVPGRNPLVLTSLSWLLLAARAAGKIAIDGVFNAIADADGFAAEARQGRNLGFDGKSVIHPSQVGPANDAFSPSTDDVDRARALVATFEAADGIATFEGSMIEELHVRDARRLLALADALAAR